MAAPPIESPGRGPFPPFPSALPLASLRRRVAALGYEAMLAAALVLAVGFLTAPFLAPPTGARWVEIPGSRVRALSFGVVCAAIALYFVWSWTGGRRTLPMKTWRIALVRADGGPVDSKTALVRLIAAGIGPAVALAAYLALKPLGVGAHASWLLALNYAWALADPQRQFLHDRIAGTRIITR